MLLERTGTSGPLSRTLHAASRVCATFCLALAVLAISACNHDDPDTGQDNYQPAQGTRTLSIQPIAQQTEVWCWAASAEMIFRHYALPNLNPFGNYQCGIVAAYYGPNSSCWFNCFTCVSTIGTASQLQTLINGYGVVANQFAASPILTTILVFSPLSFTATAREIDNGRPILAGISPTGYAYPNISQHAVVIVGYENTASGQRVIINDPFPYALFPSSPSPYPLAGATQLAPGQYSVSYTNLVSRLQWANTIYQIQRL